MQTPEISLWFEAKPSFLVHQIELVIASMWFLWFTYSDSSMFVFHTPAAMLIVLVYVDKIIVTGSDSSMIQNLIHFWNKNFALKDLGDLSYFLGIQVTPSVDSFHLCQQKYIQDLLLRMDMADCKPASTPMASDTVLSLYDGESLPDPTPYRQVVGAL